MPTQDSARDSGVSSSPDVLKQGDSGIPPAIVSDSLTTLAALAKECEGGFVPIPGRTIIDAKLMAHCMGVSVSTVNGWLKDYTIPVFAPGQKQFMDADVFLSRLPVERDDAPKKQTRKR